MKLKKHYVLDTYFIIILLVYKESRVKIHKTDTSSESSMLLPDELFDGSQSHRVKARQISI